MHDTSLLPDDYLAEARERRTNIVGLALFALVLGGVAVWFTRTNVEWREVRDRQEQVSGSFSAVALEIRDMQEQERTRREMLEKAQLAASLVDPVPRSILLGELLRRLPEKVSLLEFELRSEPVKIARPKTAAEAAPRSRAAAARSKAKPAEKPEPPRPEPLRYAVAVTLTGLAPTDLDVSEYLQRLNQLDLLESVRLEVSEEKLVDGVPTRQFRIAIRLGPDADVRRSRSLLPSTIAAAGAAAGPADADPQEFEPGFARPFVDMPEAYDLHDDEAIRAAAHEETP